MALTHVHGSNHQQREHHGRAHHPIAETPLSCLYPRIRPEREDDEYHRGEEEYEEDGGSLKRRSWGLCHVRDVAGGSP